MRVEPYLFFNGRCDEALDFYRGAIGAKVPTVVHYGDIPGAPPQEGTKDKVMHAILQFGDETVLASDGQRQGPSKFEGFSLTLTVSSDAEAERLFASLAEGGRVQLAMTSTPFASRMGMVVDRFGVPWSVVARKAE